MDSLSKIGVPIIVDLPDYYPTSASGYLFKYDTAKGIMLSGCFDFMLRRIMRHANVVTVVSSSLKTYAIHGGAKRVEIVPNGISEVFLGVSLTHRLREKMGFEDGDFVIGYVGSVEFWLDLKPLLTGIALSNKRGLPAKLFLVGNSLHTNYLKKVVEQINDEGISKNVTWHDFVPYDEVPSYLEVIDVGVIPFDVVNPTAFYSSPNKIWEYLSQMKPVISTPIPEAVNNAKFLSLASNSVDYCSLFSKLYQKDPLLLEKTQAGYLESKHRTWAYSTQCFANIVRQLLDYPTINGVRR
jgi:glycosyltransferase involved in cell wall biosynthesis